jgi:drug/metabolite transporter (DMT)-like permease
MNAAAEQPKLDLKTLTAVTVTILSWGSAFAGIRAALAAYSPAHVALLRYGTASVALAVYAVVTGMKLPALKDVPGLAGIGLLGIAFYNVALNYGQTVVPAATASFLIASAPVWMAVIAYFLYNEKLRMWGWVGSAVSFAGVAVIAMGRSGRLQVELHALIILSCALATAIYSLGQKRFLAKYSALQCTAYAIWFGTLCMLPLGSGAAAAVAAAPASATLSVLYIGIVPGALGYVTWSYALSRLPASVAGTFLYLVPAMALLTGWVWLREVPSPVSLVGGGLVLAGVVLVNQLGKGQR